MGGTPGFPAEKNMNRLYFSFYDPVPTVAPPNDDLVLQHVWLHLVEERTRSDDNRKPKAAKNVKPID